MFTETQDIATADRHLRPAAVPAEVSPAAPGGSPALELRNIRKCFGRVVALDGVSFTALPGEIHAIVGENGAGKSTLISIAAGVLPADGGSITITGHAEPRPDPAHMRAAGIAVAFQHPALPAELTVQECLSLVAPRFAAAGGAARAADLLGQVATRTLAVDPASRIGDLSIAQKHVVEIARALASEPRIVVLDEPTEPFQESDVQHLFSLLRRLCAEGKAIVYISHRLHEVRQIADRISVLRDGELIETRRSQDFSASEIIDLIVGRPVGQVFPPKLDPRQRGEVVLAAQGLGGHRFSGVDMTVHAGEIVGLAGVEGQGQREFIRALAGVQAHEQGVLRVRGQELLRHTQATARAAGICFVPDDRHAEGLFLSLSIRENIGIGQLDANGRGPFLSAAKEAAAVDAIVRRLRVKADSVQSPVSTLSGGNQQKVLFGREIGAKPTVLLVDEPTKGVDVGSRSEIYQQLRQIAASGVAVVVASSDGVELEGLCDRVLVFARGAVQRELVGQEVTDVAITEANLKATGMRRGAHVERGGPRRLERILRSDYLPAAVLLVLTGLLIGVTQGANPKFLTPYNLSIVLTFLGALAFVSFGQLCAMLVGEIDLSIGPLAGLAVVLASFMMPSTASGGVLIAGGVGIVAICALVGAAQGALVVWLGLPSMIVTLATFFGLQGLGLFLRPRPEGMIHGGLLDTFEKTFLMLPAIFIVALLATVLLEWMLWRRPLGRALRAVGSDSTSAFKLGVQRRRLVPLAFALGGALTGVGALVVAAEVGFGSAAVGVNYTLMSITAVVLGGALMGGGRGSFVCTLFGAALVQTMYSATAFLDISSAWQYWMVAFATLIAAAVFSMARAGRLKSVGKPK